MSRVSLALAGALALAVVALAALALVALLALDRHAGGGAHTAGLVDPAAASTAPAILLESATHDNADGA